jgi:hypothetical protein
MSHNQTKELKNGVGIKMVTVSTNYDIVFSFDTTGSMSQCIAEVRRKVQQVVHRLFVEIPGIKIGMIAHGDYCDKESTYLMKQVDIGSSEAQIVDFVQKVENTYGGDYPEAYEHVLREVQKMSWTSDSMRALVIIGDAYPHNKEDNPDKIDWKEEVEEIKKMGINIYSVQALSSGINGKSYTFYKQMALLTNGYHLQLGQFSTICDMLLAICFNQMGSDRLTQFEQELQKTEYGMNIGIRKMFDVMLKRTSSIEKEEEETHDSSSLSSSLSSASRSTRLSALTSVDTSVLRSCPMAKYQVLDVDEDTSIKNFVESKGLRFKTGKGYYEFTKTESIGPNKDVVLMKRDTGELYEGKEARRIIGLSDENKKYKPSEFRDYRVFIQSTSYNRKLIGGTGFLYEAEDFGRE